MKRYLVFICVLSFLTGCASQGDPIVTEAKAPISQDQQQRRDVFVGEWTSEQPTDTGGKIVTKINRAADGRYLVHFKVLNASAEVKDEQTEFGFWGVAGGIYFTIFKGWIENDELIPSNPTDAYNYDAYNIIAAEPDRLVYESLSSGNRYIYDRVN